MPRLFLRERAGGRMKAGADLKWHREFLREFDRA
jgi:hypothetical protein